MMNVCDPKSLETISLDEKQQREEWCKTRRDLWKLKGKIGKISHVRLILESSAPCVINYGLIDEGGRFSSVLDDD